MSHKMANINDGAGDLGKDQVSVKKIFGKGLFNKNKNSGEEKSDSQSGPFKKIHQPKSDLDYQKNFNQKDLTKKLAKIFGTSLDHFM